MYRTNLKSQLLTLINELCLQHGDFTLSSGVKSDYYIDLRKLTTTSHGLHLISESIYEYTKDLDFDSMGGMETAAIPLMAAGLLAYNKRGYSIDGFWVRKEAKKHGDKSLIVGDPSGHCVILEDVVTTGESMLKAALAVRAIGCHVVKVLAIVDRMQGGRQALYNENLIYESIFKITDFGIKIPGESDD